MKVKLLRRIRKQCSILEVTDAPRPTSWYSRAIKGFRGQEKLTLPFYHSINNLAKNAGLNYEVEELHQTKQEAIDRILDFARDSYYYYSRKNRLKSNTEKVWYNK